MNAMLVCVLVACGEGRRDDSTARDSTAIGDLAVGQQAAGTQPPLRDVPVADSMDRQDAAPPTSPAPPPASVDTATGMRPVPTASRGRSVGGTAPREPSRRPQAAARGASAEPAIPVTGTVAVGTPMTFLATRRVCSHLTRVGEKFTARLAASVNATNGIVVPEGATGVFEVTAARTAQGSREETYLRTRLVSVQFGGQTYPVEATVETAATERVRSATTADDAKKVASGAVIGAIAGQVLGRGTRSTVIGAAAGAAAGSAAAAMSGNYDTCLAEGGTVRVTLNTSLTVRPALVP